jgi:putative hemolysin
MRILVVIFTPFCYLAEKLSNLVVRICGLDPHANLDDVTEEEIMSMVKEGHEQGVLMTSEAEMIHNIFAFGDKDAKDIMTHRKNIVAVEVNMLLSQALEYMLEKNNSRFPVYQDNIDNVIGAIHIKDAMIQSRNPDMLTVQVGQIPKLVREIDFIPETRSINALFNVMQTQKSHIVIVVDEYGQTAGLVAMEDILEEIVGNILDEYDEEDTMIIEQGDGSFLMKGMTPLEDVCNTLNITCDLEDYDTLNGYLISLIDKIPGDHEQFSVTDNGYQFHVLSVENKMIQVVRITRAAAAAERVTTCHEAESVVE